jgi:NitT/TauT family transport system substrate-binding protein
MQVSRSEAIAALAAACAAPSFLGAAPDAAQLRIGDLPFDLLAQPYYCEEMGFFTKAGLRARLESFTTGAPIVSAVAGGALDIGGSNLVSLAIAHARKLPFVIIAPSGLYSYKAPADALVVPLNSPIKTAKDFAAKTVGVNGLKNITQFSVQAWIDKNGGDSSRVKFVEIAPAEQTAGLASGRIDGACISEPYIEPAKKVGRVLANCFDAVAPLFIVSAFFSTLEWARANVDLVRRFQSAMKESALWANANHDKSADILAKASKVNPQTVRSMYRAVYTDKLDPALMQPVVDVTAKYAGIERFPVEEMIFRG